MNDTTNRQLLDDLLQAVKHAQALPEEGQAGHFDRLGMAEISRWLLRKRWERQGRQPDQSLKQLHLHEWAHGMWAQSMARLEQMDTRRVWSDLGIYMPDVTLSIIAQDARAAATRIDAEVRRDAFGLGLRLCYLRSSDLDGYRAISDLMLARRSWENHASGLGASALRMALEQPEISEAQAFKDIEALLAQPNFRHVVPFFRWRYQHNIALFKRYTDERLHRSDPSSGLSPSALFSWTLLVWVFGGAQYDKLCRTLEIAENSPGPDTPTGATYQAISAYRSWRITPKPTPTTRLRIALCVFGQLRHFKVAHHSWDALRLEDHDVQVFVHTWRNTGRRIPDLSLGAGIERVFGHVPFRNAYLRASALYGAAALLERCHTLHAALDCGRTVNTEELHAVYGPNAQLVIEEDPGEAFGPDPANQRRMFRKMRGAVQMMFESGRDFDLCILIRPDLMLKPIGDGADLMAMADASAQGSVLFNDCLITTGNVYLDDTLAVGRPDVAAAYADVESFTRPAAEGKYWNAPPTLRAHRSIAHNAFVRGLRPVNQLGFRKAGLASEVCLSREQILAALLTDMPHGPVTELDRLLLSSLDAGK